MRVLGRRLLGIDRPDEQLRRSLRSSGIQALFWLAFFVLHITIGSRSDVLLTTLTLVAFVLAVASMLVTIGEQHRRAHTDAAASDLLS